MELTSSVRISTMANLKAEFHEHLTRPGVKNDQEMCICLPESDLKMSKSHANVVSFDKNVSYSSTLMNFYERNEQFLMNETAIENRTKSAPLSLIYNIVISFL